MMKEIVAGTCVLSACVAGAAPVVVPQPQQMREQEGFYQASSVEAVTCTRTKDASIPVEGYTLTVSPKGVAVASSDEAGAFYAMQTLRQLFDAKRGGFPCVSIVDAPAFSWRGFMVDDCRHFFGVAAVKRLIDTMSYHKFNVMHWHLTDDQGWRIAIDAYPELAVYATKRPESRKMWDRNTGDGTPYGPFMYTKAEIRDVIAYAKARHIRIVPEIEMPGHARAALAAYPELSCVGKDLAPRTPWTGWGVNDEVFCAGNDATLRFLEKVLDEVCELFDSPIIHVGGDECPKVRWNACPKCQARIKAAGLKNAHELQSWFIKHFERYLAGKGRRLIGWDEILEGGLPEGAAVMSWRGAAGGITAASSGHDVVMTPNDFCYFDYRQFDGTDKYEYIGGLVTLQKVYSFDPCAGIPDNRRAHILGGQCNNWSEYTQTLEMLEWKMFPRACALAEALWTAPKAPRDFNAFASRMTIHQPRLRAMGVNAAPLTQPAR